MASGSNDDFGKNLNILILGKARSGKSRTGNSILGDKNAFVFDEPTENCNVIKRERFGKTINVIDTPSDAALHLEKLRSISQSIEKDKTCDSFLVCLICVQIGRFSDTDLQMYSKFVEYFGEKLLQLSVVVFTNGDKWENDMDDKGIKDPDFNYYIENLSESKKDLLQKCGDRFVKFNNRREDEENDIQVKELLTLVEEVRQKNSHIKLSDIFKSVVNFTKAASSNITEKSSATMAAFAQTVGKYLISDNDIDGTNGRTYSEANNSKLEMPFFGNPAPPNEFRFVLIGKTGVGKSRVGNTILDKNAFTFALDSKSVTSVCKLDSAERFGKKIDVVDTPGVFDTEKDFVTIQKEISRSIAMSTPGPHAILFCVHMGPITEQETDVLDHYIKYFGQSILNYLIFVFTHLDSWQHDFEDKCRPVPHEDVYIKSLSEKPKSYLKKCKNRYIFLNNRATKEEKDQKVMKLIEKVEEMLSKNSNACYTDKQYEEAENILQTMMKVNSIRDELRMSESFLEQIHLNIRLILHEIYLKYIQKGQFIQ